MQHVSSPDTFRAWLKSARPGETCVYWIGPDARHCAHRREVMEAAGYFPPHRDVRARGDLQIEGHGWQQRGPMLVAPVQRRVASGFSYEAQRTRVPFLTAIR